MQNDKKNFIWNMIGATINSFTSVFFLVIVTRINGADIAGIFAFSFALACLLQVISNYSGRVFQVTNNLDELKDSDFVYNRISTTIIMIIVVFIYLLIKGYSEYKNIVIILFILYRGIESLTDIMYGVIQKNNELYKVGISLFFKGTIGTIIFVLIETFTGNLLLAISSLIVINSLIGYFYDYKNFRPYYNSNKYNNSNNIKLFKLGIFVFGFTFLTQYILNAPKYAIDAALSDEMQTVYAIVSMPAAFIVLCSQFLVQPLLVNFTYLIKNNQFKKLLNLSIKVIAYLIIIGGGSILLAYICGIPVLEFIYNMDLHNYLKPLLIILVGATFYGISFIISNILTALRKTFIQIVFYIISAIFILILSKYMVINYGVIGGTFSYMITMVLLFIMYVVYYFIIIRRKI